MAGYMNSQSSCLLLSCVSFVLIKMARLSLSPPSSSFASHSPPPLSFLFSTLQFSRRRRQRRRRKERVLLCQGWVGRYIEWRRKRRRGIAHRGKSQRIGCNFDTICRTYCSTNHSCNNTLFTVLTNSPVISNFLCLSSSCKHIW